MKQVTSKFTSKMEDTLRSYVPRMTINGAEVSGDIMYGLAINLGSCGADNPITGGVIFVPSFTATIQNCNTYLQDREVKLEIGLVLDDGTVEYIPMGYFTVEKPSVSKYTTQITAYGRLMSKMGANYTSALAYPTTVQNVATEIATKSGVAVEFKGFTTEKQLTVPKSMGLVSYRDALGSIAGLIGGYVTENADGNIVICKYTNTPVVTVDTSRCYAYPTHHDVEWEGTGIEITVPQEIKETEEEQPPEVKYTYGSQINVSYSNVWMNETAFEAVKSNLIGFKYMPSEVNFLGDLRLEPWDSIKVTDGKNDAGFNVPCMNIVHTWDGGLVTQITAPANTTAEQSGAFAGAITQAVDEVKAQMMRVVNLVADKVTTEQLEAVTGRINSLTSNQIIAMMLEANRISATYIKGGTLDTDLVDADAIATKVIASDELKANYAHIVNGYIDNANIDAIQINKINGNPIVEGSILAEALAGHMATTLGGNKFIYQADHPSGTEWKVGDTWFKTVTESGNVSASNMYVWSGSQWVETPLDSTVLRAGAIGAREISTEYEYAGIVYADKIIVGSKESPEGELNNTLEDIGTSMQGAIDGVAEDIAGVNRNIESMQNVDNDYAQRLENIHNDINDNSLISQDYATINNGTLTLGYRDNEWKLVARGEGIDLMYGNTTVGTFGKYGTNGSQLKANNSELQTVRFRSTQGGSLGLVTSSDGHVTLKEVR